ncbi:MAG: Rieske 2Fe-2S domain-containing protein [Pseudomonadota bacterium]
MAETARLICAAVDLIEAGEGVRFEVEWQGETAAAFLVRWKGQARAYLNRCAHIPVELDYQPGRFFDFSSEYLVCSTHGALYDPSTGACAGGRCNGAGLVPVPVQERDGGIYLMASAREGT